MAMRNMTRDALTQAELSARVQDIRPEYFESKRWFGSKTRTIRDYRALDVGLLEVESELFGVVLLEIAYTEGDAECYFLPLAFRPEHQVPTSIKSQPAGAAFVMTTPNGDVWAYDAFEEDRFCAVLYEGMYDDRELQMEDGRLLFRHVPGVLRARDVQSVKRIRTEQSNTSTIYNGQLILKTFRKLSVGRNPDFEVPYFLTTHTEFRYVPRVAGFIEYGGSIGDEVSVGSMQDFVTNQGDGYTNALNRVRDYFANVLPFIDGHPDYTSHDQLQQASLCVGNLPEAVRRLGYITGEMHNALSGNSDQPAFKPEPITRDDATRWEQSITQLITRVTQRVRDRMRYFSPSLQALLRPVADHEHTFLQMASGLGVLEKEGCHKTRYHGDYHLGQVLKTGDDFMILDFEGEPARSLAERRAKHCPLKDVAGMLRSFDYAVYAILFEIWGERRLDESEKAELERWALTWEDIAQRTFLEGYCAATSHHSGLRFMPADDAAFDRVVKIFEVEKAFYELAYEFNNRPTWIPIPAKGVLRILGEDG